MKFKTYYTYLFSLGLILLIFGCEDSTTEPIPQNSGITGSVLFLDGSVGALATIELQKLSNNSRTYTNADDKGIYTFEKLSSGSYLIKFKSNSYNINSFEQEVTISSNETYIQDIYILYNMLDEASGVVKNDNVFLIKFQPDGAKIGSNLSSVNYLSGTYFGDYNNQYTLSSDIYKIPDSLDWFGSDSVYTRNNIRNNFEYITSVDESLFNSRHEIKFTGNDIANILSNPSNGFAFVTRESDDRKIRIPCIDFNNNDFGFKIYYKE